MLARILALTLLAAPAAAATGRASWYADNPGGRTGCGERFDPYAMTAASYAYPCNTRLRVVSRGRAVIVRVNDRGPNRSLHRLVDLSREAAGRLGMLHDGVRVVQVHRLSR